MNTLTLNQYKSLARAATALRLAIFKGNVSLAAARTLLAGNPQTASAALGLTIGCDAERNVTHDLKDLKVRQALAAPMAHRKTSSVLDALKELRADCHAAIDRNHMFK